MKIIKKTSFLTIILTINFLVYPLNSPSAEYLYPVGYDQQQQQFYLLCQSQFDQLKLWSWDPETKVAFPATLSSFNPAGFQFLPDQSGFSFIDHGLVRIKNYNRRLVRTIELHAPLINLNSIIWQNSETFCFCAQLQDNYGIFQANLTHKTPQVTTLLWSNGIDYLYPQIIGTQLFCIKHDPVSQLDAIVSFKLDQFPPSPKIDSGPNHSPNSWLINQAELKPEDGCKLFTTIANSRIALKFLKFTSLLQGYFLAQVLSRTVQVVSFDCYSLQITDPESQVKKLFSFDLPRVYFSDSQALDTPTLRLHESILPFLPRYTAEKIYFCTQILNSNLESPTYTRPSNHHHFLETQSSQSVDQPDLCVDIFSYDLANSEIKQLTQAQNNQLFCGIVILPNGQLCYGGNAFDFTKASLTKSEQNQQLTHTTIPIVLDEAWGLPLIELPFIAR